MPKKVHFLQERRKNSVDRNYKNSNALIGASCVACAGRSAVKIVRFVFGQNAPL